MNNIRLCIGILIVLTILSCSSDDNVSNNNPPNLTSRVYKKASSFENAILISSQELFYNTDGNLQQIVTDIDNGSKVTTIDIEYNSAGISKIINSISFGNSTNSTVKEYSITTTNNQIKLIGINGNDHEIQIDFTNKYVDAYREITPSNMMIIREELFLRNTDNNLVRHSGVGNSGNITFEYSNYDLGSVMPFHREYSIDYLLIFNLKPSEKLPLTEVYNENGISDTFTIDSSTLTYDSENNIINQGDNTNYTAYDYINL